MTSRPAPARPVNLDPPDALTRVLSDAAEAASQAPSILNTQPWAWQIRAGVLQLRADRSRQVHSIDPQGRLLTLSCGAALHHARVALAAAGHAVTSTRFPAPGDGDALAEIRITGPHPASHADIQLRQAMRDRRTDRRPFAATRPVRAEILAALAAAALLEGAWLHQVGEDQLPFLTLAARAAQKSEAKDEQYLADLRHWTRRSHADREGVPPETVLASPPRPVSLRNFAPDGDVLLHPGSGDDRFAEYLIVATQADNPADWLAGGAATSAVWLAATQRGLAVSPLSDVVEVPGARALIASLLPESGHPQLVLRVGFGLQPTPPPASPRRRVEVAVKDE